MIASFAVIVVGLLSILALSAWRIVAVVLLAPTFFGGYSAAAYTRNRTKLYFLEDGRPAEDAELGSILAGVGVGLFGTVGLAGLQVAVLLALRSLGLIV
jgi:hypothetical protein